MYGVIVVAAVERDEQARLVDEVHAGLEVVADPAHAGDAPREVVAELPLRLLGRLRRVRVLRRSRRRWGRSASGSVLLRGMAFVKSAILEDELVQLRPAEHPVVVHVDRIERVLARAPVARRRLRRGAVRLRVGVAAVAHRQVLRRVQVRRCLAGDQVLAIRRREDAVMLREQARVSRPPGSCPAACARRRRSNAPGPARSDRRTIRRTGSGGSPAFDLVRSFSGLGHARSATCRGRA